MVQHRFRIRFCKTGELRLISHRDLVRALERMFRRAGLQLAMSEGFHPKPRMSFAVPLALGMAGLDEVLEVALVEWIEPERLLEALNAQAPDGISFHAAEHLPAESKKAQATSLRFEVPLPDEFIEPTRNRVARFLAADTWLVERPDRIVPVDLRPQVERLEVVEGMLTMQLAVVNEAAVRPRDLLAVLELSALDDHGLHLTRTAVELKP